jgi:hypothetical protein
LRAGRVARQRRATHRPERLRCVSRSAQAVALQEHNTRDSNAVNGMADERHSLSSSGHERIRSSSLSRAHVIGEVARPRHSHRASDLSRWHPGRVAMRVSRRLGLHQERRTREYN